ncbi:MAG: hypothetical protein Q8Q12_11400 [bacterium]|jgi:hypothetical protein|nr:hypothetical protein [bacterium]
MTCSAIPSVVGFLACISIPSTLNAAEWYVDATLRQLGDAKTIVTASGSDTDLPKLLKMKQHVISEKCKYMIEEMYE